MHLFVSHYILEIHLRRHLEIFQNWIVNVNGTTLDGRPQILLSSKNTQKNLAEFQRDCDNCKSILK
ncbi:CLUMA_CG015023, isoform A [Clunio marinus]|uniref:CLUMA_CG015023, isoform A n=1 Tax=Clunio marinus TaxID=568069 RepID=A0A1J1INI4_9DIPT|nr:CLUMA_CG015023, isoform A [Clunio marinus]